MNLSDRILEKNAGVNESLEGRENDSLLTRAIKLKLSGQR